MTPREALAQFGVVYQVATCSTGADLCVHLTAECSAVTVDKAARELTHAGQLPLRCRLCKACDPDATVEMAPDYDDVPAIEDHDDRPAWAPSEVADD